MAEFDARAAAARFFAVEELSAKELAEYRSFRGAHSRGMWWDVTRWRSDFEQAIRACRASGSLPDRPGPGYRTWDLAAVLAEMARGLECSLRTPYGSVRVRPRVLDALRGLEDLDEEWWAAAESCRIASRRALVVHSGYPCSPELLDGRELSTLETEALDLALQERQRTVAASLVGDEDCWVQRLRLHAALVLRLRRASLDGPSRLVAAQLDMAIVLAMLRLGLPYRDLRRRVGTLNADLRTAALTAASWSHLQRARDAALDELEKHRPEAQALLDGMRSANPDPVEAGPLDESSCERLLDLLDESGLCGWYSELTTVGWGEHFVDMSDEQRRAVVHGRVRTLAALTEEFLPAVVSHAAGPEVGLAVLARPTMRGRVECMAKLLEFRALGLDLERLKLLAKGASPPFSRDELRGRFAALGIHARDDVRPAEDFTALLAALLFIRNLVVHRYPSKGDSSGEAWRDVFADVLAGINDRMAVAVLVLWGLAEGHRLRLEGSPGSGDEA